MLSILLSIISVFSGLVPIAVFKIILMMINNAYTINSIMVYIFIALITYISQVCCFERQRCYHILRHMKFYLKFVKN